MNDAYNVVADDFRQDFVHHGPVRLAAQEVAKLPLNHGVCGLDITPFVVVRQELFAAEGEVVEHLGPQTASSPGMVALEEDEGSTARRVNGREVLDTRVCLVRREVADGEVFFRSVDHLRQLYGIGRVLVLDDDGRYDVGFDAACQVDLDPTVLAASDAVLVIVPRLETASCEARRIASKVHFHGTQRQTAFRDECVQDRRQVGVRQGVRDGIEMQVAADKSILNGLTEVRHEMPGRDGRVDLEARREHGIRQRDARTAGSGLWRLRDCLAEVAKEDEELFLFVRLRRVVGRPILWVGGLLDGFCHGHGAREDGIAVGVLFALHGEFDGENVLALAAAFFVVRASAVRVSRIGANCIAAVARLRRHEPNVTLLFQLTQGRDCQTVLFSHFHRMPPLFCHRGGLPKIAVLRQYSDRRSNSCNQGYCNYNYITVKAVALDSVRFPSYNFRHGKATESRGHGESETASGSRPRAGILVLQKCR